MVQASPCEPPSRKITSDKDALLLEVQAMVNTNTESFNKTIMNLVNIHLQTQNKLIESFMDAKQDSSANLGDSSNTLQDESIDSRNTIGSSSQSFSQYAPANPDPRKMYEDYLSWVTESGRAKRHAIDPDISADHSNTTASGPFSIEDERYAHGSFGNYAGVSDAGGKIEEAIAPIQASVKRLEINVLQIAAQLAAGENEQAAPTGWANRQMSNLSLASCESWQEVEPVDDEMDTEAEDDQGLAKVGANGSFNRQQTAKPEALSQTHLSLQEMGGVGALIYKVFKPQIDWFLGLEEPEREGPLAEVVLSSKFETVAALGILGNMAWMWVSTNNDIQNPGTPLPGEQGVELFFVAFFGVEFALKIAVHRQYYFCNEQMAWNTFDFILVVASIFEQVMAGGGQAGLMRMLRTFKLAKILRGARLMRFFSQLSLMLNSLMGSLTTLFWSFVMLALLFFLFGVVMVQGVGQFIQDEPSIEPELHEGLLQYFGSIETTMLTLYKTMFGGDDWSIFYEKIAATGSTNAWFFIIFVAVMEIAMMNILTGIFVDCAMKLAIPDKEEQAAEARREKMDDRKDFMELYREIQRLHAKECNDAGIVTKAAVQAALHNGKLMSYMEVLGMSIKDKRVALEVWFPKGAEEVSPKQFADACFELRGQATSIDLHSLMIAVARMKEKMDRQNRRTLKEIRLNRRTNSLRKPFMIESDAGNPAVHSSIDARLSM